MLMQKLRNAQSVIQGHRIPELPEEIFKLEAELGSKFPDMQAVADIIERNTSLSGEVIKVINSPVMKLNLPEPIHSIREAVNFMGLDNLYNLVVASALHNAFADNDTVKEIMEHSVDVAFCMAELSEHVLDMGRDQAYMLGLFHNSGAMMLATLDESRYAPIFSNSLSNPLGVLQKEQAEYQTDHTMVGVLVTQKWKLPTPLINAVMLHHNKNCATIKSDQVRAMVAMLKIANSLVSEFLLGAYAGGEFRAFEQDGVNELALRKDVINQVRRDMMNFSHSK